MESDFLLGYLDQYRMGGLRFKLKEDGPFLDAQLKLWRHLHDIAP